jgi:hypothetical protein
LVDTTLEYSANQEAQQQSQELLRNAAGEVDGAQVHVTKSYDARNMSV